MIPKPVRSLLLPLLAVLYPLIFLFGQNADIVSLKELWLPALAALVIGAFVYGIFLLFQRNHLKASFSALIFLIFFYLYGSIFEYSRQIDIVLVENYLLLPLVVVIAGYAGYFVTKLKRKTLASIQGILLLLLTVLVLFNVILAVPAEMRSAQGKRFQKTDVTVTTANSKKYPDIYYVVIDEYAGSELMREFWKSNHVVEFETYLRSKGFFVATQSESRTIRTVVELSSRLSLKLFPADMSDVILEKQLSECPVCQILKEYGYTTVVFNPLYPTKYRVDKEIQFEDPEVVGEVGLGVSNFNLMILDQTMLRVFSNFYRAKDKEVLRVRNMIIYSLENTPSPPGVKSPKFVLTHLIIVHTPFVFNEYGGFLDPKFKLDWNYYLGAHKYATMAFQKLVDNILNNADPDNPPVIVLQSDHGARNLKLPFLNSVILENYPEKYQKNLLNALYLPGYDTSQLTNDLDPVDTFEIILNHYLDAGVSVDRSEIEK